MIYTYRSVERYLYACGYFAIRYSCLGNGFSYPTVVYLKRGAPFLATLRWPIPAGYTREVCRIRDDDMLNWDGDE